MQAGDLDDLESLVLVLSCVIGVDCALEQGGDALVLGVLFAQYHTILARQRRAPVRQELDVDLVASRVCVVRVIFVSRLHERERYTHAHDVVGW